MPRTIILPQSIEKRLDQLTSLKEETNGVLLYEKIDDLCFVDYLYVTGVGTEGQVWSDPSRVKIVDHFFKLNPKYQFIKFHTHTLGTIRSFGEQYAREFSEGDIETIKKQLSHDKEYMAMLVTPETKLISGMDNPQLRIVEQSERCERNHKIIEAKINQIAVDINLPQEIFKGIKLR